MAREGWVERRGSALIFPLVATPSDVSPSIYEISWEIAGRLLTLETKRVWWGVIFFAARLEQGIAANVTPTSPAD